MQFLHSRACRTHICNYVVERTPWKATLRKSLVPISRPRDVEDLERKTPYRQRGGGVNTDGKSDLPNKKDQERAQEAPVEHDAIALAQDFGR